MPAPSLTRIVHWVHSLAAEVLMPGTLGVDLTAGSGQDTLFLWEQVAPTGRVISFDIQPAALDETATRLLDVGAPLQQVSKVGGRIDTQPGVYLVEACHSQLGEFVDAAPRVILANLGYHPGGAREVITRPATTLAALQVAAGLLAVGGRLAVTVYPGHSGGTSEAAAVTDWFTALTPRHWEALLLRVANREQAPFLLLAEKRGDPCPGAATGKDFASRS